MSCAPRMLPIAAIARALGVPRRTAQRWAVEGSIEGAHRIGARGAWRVPATWLERELGARAETTAMASHVATRADVEVLRAEVAIMRAELRALRAAVESAPSAPSAPRVSRPRSARTP